jgi:hypothetical protein
MERHGDASAPVNPLCLRDAEPSDQPVAQNATAVAA